MDASPVFEFSDTSYQSYLDHGREKEMHIFDFDFENDTFVQRQGAYLDRVLRDESDAHEIFAITPAITIDRTVINFRTFKENDTLVVDMRLLNQSTHTLDVIRDRCAVKISGNTFKPCHFTSDSVFENNMDNVYLFKPGTRLHLNLKFCIAEEIDQWALVRDWLLIHQSGSAGGMSVAIPFLHSDIVFRKSSITR